MAILIDKDTRVIVQGITGTHGSFHTDQMLGYGTKIVAGVTPGKGGQKVSGAPVYNTVRAALKDNDAGWSCIFVPASHAKAAAREALNNGLNIVIITEGMPVHDTLDVLAFAKKKRLLVIGPNCPGLLMPERSKIGIIPAKIATYNLVGENVGVVSRSGTLTYEIVSQLSAAGIGQSAIVGIGGDQVVGTDFCEILRMFEEDSKTDKIVLIGEIGGDAEERAATYINKNISKQVVAYIAGRTAPKGKTMGHAGAIISGDTGIGTAESKIAALQKARVQVAETPGQIIDMLRQKDL